MGNLVSAVTAMARQRPSMVVGVGVAVPFFTATTREGLT